ncbi:hypothetical protein EXIGLDRAFT_695898 [Exidia glandulosa HHB12029]|uniref:Uncharacterized protein n=1 Tax=Exidia glandulosa HHB12029 TaxID=1314781 RepID=A0A165QE84_EXIGL|nr:hypothetical protein EXIGLDRAFT_695898 [Exidia glandulosa HHB12029]
MSSTTSPKIQALTAYKDETVRFIDGSTMHRLHTKPFAGLWTLPKDESETCTLIGIEYFSAEIRFAIRNASEFGEGVERSTLQARTEMAYDYCAGLARQLCRLRNVEFISPSPPKMPDPRPVESTAKDEIDRAINARQLEVDWIEALASCLSTGKKLPPEEEYDPKAPRIREAWRDEKPRWPDPELISFDEGMRRGLVGPRWIAPRRDWLKSAYAKK